MGGSIGIHFSPWHKAWILLIVFYTKQFCETLVMIHWLNFWRVFVYVLWFSVFWLRFLVGTYCKNTWKENRKKKQAEGEERGIWGEKETAWRYPLAFIYLFLKSQHVLHILNTCLRREKNEQKEVWHKRGKKRKHLKSVFILLSENGIKKCMCYVLRISNLKMQKALACQMPGIQSKFSGAIDHAPLLIHNSWAILSPGWQFLTCQVLITTLFRLQTSNIKGRSKS